MTRFMISDEDEYGPKLYTHRTVEEVPWWDEHGTTQFHGSTAEWTAWWASDLPIGAMLIEPEFMLPIENATAIAVHFTGDWTGRYAPVSRMRLLDPDT